MVDVGELGRGLVIGGVKERSAARLLGAVLLGVLAAPVTSS